MVALLVLFKDLGKHSIFLSGCQVLVLDGILNWCGNPGVKTRVLIPTQGKPRRIPGRYRGQGGKVSQILGPKEYDSKNPSIPELA